jgi:hypothetical protein
MTAEAAIQTLSVVGVWTNISASAGIYIDIVCFIRASRAKCRN